MTKEEFVTLALSRWPELEELDQEKDFYEFEKRFEPYYWTFLKIA